MVSVGKLGRKQTAWIRQQSAGMCPKQELLFRAGLMQATKYAKHAGPLVVLRQIPGAEPPKSCWNTAAAEMKATQTSSSVMFPASPRVFDINPYLFFFEIPSSRPLPPASTSARATSCDAPRGWRVAGSKEKGVKNFLNGLV